MLQIEQQLQQKVARAAWKYDVTLLGVPWFSAVIGTNCRNWYWLPSLVLTTVIGTDYPLPASLTRQWLSEIIAKFDIPGRDATLYIQIYKLARTPDTEYGEHGITLQW